MNGFIADFVPFALIACYFIFNISSHISSISQERLEKRPKLFIVLIILTLFLLAKRYPQNENYRMQCTVGYITDGSGKADLYLLLEGGKRLFNVLKKHLKNENVVFNKTYKSPLLEGAADASSRAVSVSLESHDVRLMVMNRLKQLQEQLGSIDTLPKEPLEASALLTIEKPDDISKLHLVRVKGNDKGLFAAIVPPESKGKEAPEEPEPMADEDDDVLLDRIRAKLKDDLSKDRSRRSRENDRYSTLRSAVNSGMSDAMKSEAIGSVLFERAMDILGVDFEAVFVISTTFFEKNSLDHILSDLSSPADFNLELRAIYEFLKETKKI